MASCRVPWPAARRALARFGGSAVKAATAPDHGAPGPAAQRQAPRRWQIDQAGDRRRRHGRAPRAEAAEQVLGAGHGMAGLAGDAGAAADNRFVERGEARSRRTPRAAGLSQGDSAGSGSWREDKRASTGIKPGSGPLPIRAWAMAALAEPAALGLGVCSRKKAVGFWEEGVFGGER